MIIARNKFISKLLLLSKLKKIYSAAYCHLNNRISNNFLNIIISLIVDIFSIHLFHYNDIIYIYLSIIYISFRVNIKFHNPFTHNLSLQSITSTRQQFQPKIRVTFVRMEV